MKNSRLLGLKLAIGLSLSFGLSFGLSSIAKADISVEQGYFRASPPGVNSGAAFLSLHNSDKAQVLLTGVQTPAADSAELHNHVEHQGMMQMRRVEAISIPPQGSVNLEPGGYHIMLMGLKAPLKAGNEMMLRLEFSDGQSIKLLLPIKKIQGHNSPKMMKHSSH